MEIKGKIAEREERGTERKLKAKEKEYDQQEKNQNN